jgi:signal transduction histidine kinase/DNA-binding response OmpR family regulator
MHKLLARQIRRHLGGGESIPARLAPFLAAVDDAYEQADSDRAMLERSLELSSRQLSSRNIELRRAKELAEAASSAKSEFLANMSHEIRTPMNAMVGMTSLLLETPLGSEQEEYTQTIRQSCDALLGIINDILDFSKIEAGRLELEEQPFDLRECLESACDLMAGQAAEKGLELVCSIDPEMPQVIIGDVTRLRQILVNLLSNAVKFTEAGEVVLSAWRGGKREEEETTCAGGAAAGGDERSLLCFSVRDNGIGIPPARMDRLFSSFSQVDASTTRKYGGTGLGLAISRNLTELMGGGIWVESEEGKGSAFHFSIRCLVLDPSLADEAAPDRCLLDGRRVLIVDASESSRQAITAHCRSWGIKVECTSSSAEAVDVLSRGDLHDAVIVDQRESEQEVGAIMSELGRRRVGNRRGAVVLIGMGRRVGHTAVPSAAFLTKPIKQSQLYNALVNSLAIGRQSSKDAPPSGGSSIFDSRMGESHPLRILLAEDNIVNQRLGRKLLERLGYRADVAANGLEVLEAIQRQHYDLVFMDLQMPEMGGLEATRVIRREQPDLDLRIVAMTANVMQGDRIQCIESGMDDFLCKPIQVKELIRALAETSPAHGGASEKRTGTDG